jgi:sulfate/thiosulfate-binding protein
MGLAHRYAVRPETHSRIFSDLMKLFLKMPFPPLARTLPVRWAARCRAALWGAGIGLALLLGSGCDSGPKERRLLNVSYDPTREFYADFNREFCAYWQQAKGETVHVSQSHGGSGKQARSVRFGLPADVVTLALEPDIDFLAKESKRLPENWIEKFPFRSAPYTSTIVFLVRKGNPKQIQDWGDLEKPGIQVITPNPKTGGGARWNYLAAWAWAELELGGNPPRLREYIRKVLANVPVWDSGARGAANTFAQRGIGDVLITWENEAFLLLREQKDAGFEMVMPSVSLLARPPVAVVEENARRRGNLDLAQEYLQYLYSPTGQRLAARHFFRPTVPEQADAADMERFQKVELLTVEKIFGGWERAQKMHFAEGGSFDQLNRR